MYRGSTALTVVAVLAAALLALQLFAPTASFATAHTHSQVEAKAQLGTKPSGTSSRPGHKSSGKTLRDETATCRAGHHGDPTGPLRTRDRSHTADSAPSAPERPLRRDLRPAVPEPVRPDAAHHHASRSSTSHTPAALQVFRC
ncbi:hypothetical protein SAMN06272771_6143 [Streptomyces sp. Ag82_O1-12]|uniref:hypothetical protein n=1 Tax=unclassified Streptomyces TaxID=2593676 RepID=UPI000BC7BA69|nr:MULTISPECIES: hypothetical protein [unclassified Streptomyces]SMQ19654.1 hypothetical protein SAMN06272771_6143 [Streptomyces sp. Ag82_O1-12]SOD48695.1 hypothetical protein SAMN06272727_6147 [Streptomyces sp. Ag82_G6-1]